MVLIRRRNVRNMPHRLRAYGMYAKMRSELRRKLRLAELLATLLKSNYVVRVKQRERALKLFLATMLSSIFNILFVDVPSPVRRKHNPRTIESFSPFDCYRRFRIRKPDLKRVLRLLEIPIHVKLENGSVFTGEEIFLFGLNRFTTCAHIDDLISTYGRESSQWVRAFKWFILFMLNRWGYLLTRMLHFWVRYFEAFSEKIRRKLIKKGHNGGLPWLFRICCFIDCTVISSCRPGSGPAGDGVDAPRYNNYIQMAFYNGWKHHHGTKWQSVESPIGVCMDMFGPRSFKRCDLNLLNSSNINNKMADVQLGKPEQNQKCLFGDGIYPTDTHLLSRAFGGADGMASIRIANEWDYGITANLFPFIKWRSAQKLLSSKDISYYYFVATILRNINVILYGCVTSSYFETDDDYLEDMCDLKLDEYLSNIYRI